MEVKRQLDVLDRRLRRANTSPEVTTPLLISRSFLGYGGLAKGLAYGAGEFLSVQDYRNVQRWTDAIPRATGGEAWTHGQSHIRRSFR